MKRVDVKRVTEDSESEILFANIELANTIWTRFKGLQLRHTLGCDEGLLLVPCSSIHMFFMRFPIDAVYLDRNNCVLAIQEGLKPWTVAPLVKHAHKVLELAAGRAGEAGVRVGETLLISKVSA